MGEEKIPVSNLFSKLFDFLQSYYEQLNDRVMLKSADFIENKIHELH